MWLPAGQGSRRRMLEPEPTRFGVWWTSKPVSAAVHHWTELPNGAFPGSIGSAIPELVVDESVHGVRYQNKFALYFVLCTGLQWNGQRTRNANGLVSKAYDACCLTRKASFNSRRILHLVAICLVTAE